MSNFKSKQIITVICVLLAVTLFSCEKSDKLVIREHEYGKIRINKSDSYFYLVNTSDSKTLKFTVKKKYEKGSTDTTETFTLSPGEEVRVENAVVNYNNRLKRLLVVGAEEIVK